MHSLSTVYPPFICLKPNNVSLFFAPPFFPGNRNRRQNINKHLPLFRKVPESNSRLFPPSKPFFNLPPRKFVGGPSPLVVAVAACRVLEKSTVVAEYFGAGVAGQVLEGLGAVDDWHVGHCGVAEHESHAAVDVSYVDRWIWTLADADLRNNSC